MNVSTFVTNLKTYLEGLTWTSPDGEGTAGFQAVYSYENWDTDAGSPFVCILDNPSGPGKMKSNKYIELTTDVDIYVCVNWSQLGGSDDNAKREEANLVLREISDTLKTELIKESTEQTLGADFIYDLTYSRSDRPELNLFRRLFTITFKELISR